MYVVRVGHCSPIAPSPIAPPYPRRPLQVMCSKFVSTAIQWEEEPTSAPATPAAPQPLSGNRVRTASSAGGGGGGGGLESLTLALIQVDRLAPALGMYKVRVWVRVSRVWVWGNVHG